MQKLKVVDEEEEFYNYLHTEPGMFNTYKCLVQESLDLSKSGIRT